MGLGSFGLPVIGRRSPGRDRSCGVTFISGERLRGECRRDQPSVLSRPFQCTAKGMKARDFSKEGMRARRRGWLPESAVTGGQDRVQGGVSRGRVAQGRR